MWSDDTDLLIRNMMNISISCFLGNFYGYAWNAEATLIKILELVPDIYRKKYLKEKWYYDSGLLSNLQNNQSIRRLKNNINKYFGDDKEVMKILECTASDYREMSYAVNIAEYELREKYVEVDL